MAELSVFYPLDRQAERISPVLKRAGVDALIVAGPENAIYLSGAYNPVRRVLPERPAIVIWPREGSPILLAATVEEAFLRQASLIPDLRFYAEPVGAAPLVAQSLRDRGLLEGTLGFDLESISALFYVDLVRELQSARIVDASHVLSELRAIKSEGEIALLRRAAQATDRAEWAALDAFRLSWTESELGVSLRRALIGEGAESVTFLTLGGSGRGVAAHATPSGARLLLGDVLRFDMGGVFDGYASDLAKTACVGDPSRRQREIYRGLRLILDHHIARIRPGARAADLYQAVAADFQQARLDFRAPHVGHGIGLATHEWPILSANSEAVMMPGMVICAELIYLEENRERYHIEELVAVREDGPEVVSRSRPPAAEIPVIG